jgi:hypothetical protein
MVKARASALNKWGLTNGRVLELVIGLTANQAIVWAFNFGIYPFVIYRFGILKGGVVMTVLSFIVCMTIPSGFMIGHSGTGWESRP